MAKSNAAADLLICPFPTTIAKVKREKDVTDLPPADVMSRVRLYCDADTAVVFFRRGEALIMAPVEKAPCPE